MRAKGTPSGRRRSAAPVSAIHERAGNLPRWAFEIHQNASADEMRLVAPDADCRSATTEARLMTVKEAATLLRVSTKTIRRLIKREELQAVRIGRTVRLRPADVLRIIEYGQ
jgi:excisionase family DNA binding protein